MKNEYSVIAYIMKSDGETIIAVTECNKETTIGQIHEWLNDQLEFNQETIRVQIAKNIN